MSRIRTAAALAAGALVAIIACAAGAQGQTANVRLYVVTAEAADVSVDGSRPFHVPGQNVYFIFVPPGTHHFVVQSAGSPQIAEDVDLRVDQQIQARGRSWWCLAVARRPGAADAVLMQLDQSQCQKVTDDAPADDVPGGH
jgi:hypothetical protein